MSLDWWLIGQKCGPTLSDSDMTILCEMNRLSEKQRNALLALMGTMH